MRSSAIAEELIARGEDVVFVGQVSGLPWVEERIRSLGFSRIYSNPDDFGSNPESDVLLLDSYDMAPNEAFIDTNKWRLVISIVDEKTPDYMCDLRIHPGLDSLWVGRSQVPILAGPKYIPLRKSITRREGESGTGPLKIAVVAGGSDPFNFVFEIASILTGFLESFKAYLFSDSISIELFDARFHKVKIGPMLDELISGIDLVFTTSSTSSLEFIARGLPIGIVCAVDNQMQYYKSLGEFEVASQVGYRNSFGEWDLNTGTIHQLIIDSGLRESLTNKGRGLIDLNGAGKIVDAIKTIKRVPKSQN